MDISNYEPPKYYIAETFGNAWKPQTNLQNRLLHAINERDERLFLRLFNETLDQPDDRFFGWITNLCVNAGYEELVALILEHDRITIIRGPTDTTNMINWGVKIRSKRIFRGVMKSRNDPIPCIINGIPFNRDDDHWMLEQLFSQELIDLEFTGNFLSRYFHPLDHHWLLRLMSSGRCDIEEEDIYNDRWFCDERLFHRDNASILTELVKLRHNANTIDNHAVLRRLLQDYDLYREAITYLVNSASPGRRHPLSIDLKNSEEYNWKKCGLKVLSFLHDLPYCELFNEEIIRTSLVHDYNLRSALLLSDSWFGSTGLPPRIIHLILEFVDDVHTSSVLHTRIACFTQVYAEIKALRVICAVCALSPCTCVTLFAKSIHTGQMYPIINKITPVDLTRQYKINLTL